MMNKKLIYCCIILRFFIFMGFSQSYITLGENQQPVYPFSITDDTLPSYFANLISLFSSKQTVALGEATHGSKEFYEAKKKLIKFMFTRCGFRKLLVEAPFGNCLYANDYIQGRASNLDSALKAINTWIFYTPEFRDLLAWMRQYNQDKVPADQVSFYGFDMQSASACISFIQEHLSPLARDATLEFSQIVLPFPTSLSLPSLNKVFRENKELYNKLLTSAQLLEDWSTRHKAELIKHHPPHTVQLLQLSAQAIHMFLLYPDQPYQYRDSCMARLFLQIQQMDAQPDKDIIWAHNAHISLYDSLVNYETYRNTMGNYIFKYLKKLYYPIGFIFNSGSFLALEPRKRKKEIVYPYLKSFFLKPNPPGSLSYVLNKPGITPFFLDIENTKNELLRRYHKVYTTGATYTNRKSNNVLYITPALAFRGLIFISEVSSARQIDNYLYPLKD